MRVRAILAPNISPCSVKILRPLLAHFQSTKVRVIRRYTEGEVVGDLAPPDKKHVPQIFWGTCAGAFAKTVCASRALYPADAAAWGRIEKSSVRTLAATYSIQSTKRLVKRSPGQTHPQALCQGAGVVVSRSFERGAAICKDAAARLRAQA